MGMDSGLTGGTGGTGGTGTGGSPTVTTTAVVCGGETCMVSAGAMMLGTTACCTADDTCGGMTALAAECIPLGLEGSYDESCPDFNLDTGIFPLTWTGCCTPDGVCGALEGSEGGFGCIPNDFLASMLDGGVGQTCDYDPNATCTSILTAYCDGPEDCPGQQCCGEYGGNGYSSFTCQDSCVDLAAMGGIWSEVCHPEMGCDQPSPDAGMNAFAADAGASDYQCRRNTTYLPDFWYRCRDTGELPDVSESGSTAAGEINCGDTVCGDGEKCCYALDANAPPADGSTPINSGTAHCVGVDEPCTCAAPPDDSDSGLDDDAG
jgi:hypothetical protein